MGISSRWTGPLPASSGLERPPAAAWNKYALMQSLGTHATVHSMPSVMQVFNHFTLWCCQIWTLIQVRIHMLQAYAHRHARCMLLELSIRSNVSNTPWGCLFFFSSLHVFSYRLLFYIPLTSFCWVVLPLVSPPPPLSLINFAPSGHLLSKGNVALSTFRSFSVCPLLTSKDIFWWTCLTECIPALST